MQPLINIKISENIFVKHILKLFSKGTIYQLLSLSTRFYTYTVTIIASNLKLQIS